VKLYACRECKRITELDICEVCRSKTSSNWVGLVAISDPERSEIARKMGIRMKGKYALKVR